MSELTLYQWAALIGLVLAVSGTATGVGIAYAAWQAWRAQGRTGDDPATAPTACQQHPGCCAHDARCRDTHCPGHPINLRRQRRLPT